jgi:hypothetical protein
MRKSKHTTYYCTAYARRRRHEWYANRMIVDIKFEGVGGGVYNI